MPSILSGQVKVEVLPERARAYVDPDTGEENLPTPPVPAPDPEPEP